MSTASFQPSNQLMSKLDAATNANDIKGLDTLRHAARAGDSEAIEKAAEQFEAIFVQMLLKSMRSAQDVMSDKNSPFNSEQVKFYRDMHDTQLANELASNGSLGLAEIIVQQLDPNAKGVIPASTIRNDGNLSSLNLERLQSVEKAKQQVLGDLSEQASLNAFKQAAFTDKQDFVSTLLPVAEEYSAELNLSPKALVAQAAVETGWGKHMIHQSDGRNSHNLFGIKADGRWQGEKAAVNTLEFKQGVAEQQKAHFRAYDSFADAMADYVDFVKSSDRYQSARAVAEQPDAYFKALQQAGYATDPKYADKVMAVLNSGALDGNAQNSVE